jgi:hypothetical protein
MMQVITFDPNDSQYEYFYKLLDDYRHTITGKKSENYKNDRFDLKKMIAISVAIQETKIKFFSSIFRRNDWHPSVVRVMNRTYKDESIRINNGDGFVQLNDSRPITSLLTAQIDFAKKRGYTNFFISREGNSKNFLNFYKSWCTCATESDWTLYDDKCWTCPSINGNSCHQYLLYNSIHGDFCPRTMLSA